MQEQPGTAHPITRYGEAVLHTRCAEVTRYGDELTDLVADMFASMYAANGIGLAANQIGVGLRVFVYDCPGETDEDERHIGHVVNPVLAAPKGRRYRVLDGEGCLSVPGQHAGLARADIATVSGFDLHGRPLTVRGTGLLARCFQHEVDHLDGIVYVDRLPRKQRKAILAAAGLPA
jgi:peptide deformylase